MDESTEPQTLATIRFEWMSNGELRFVAEGDISPSNFFIVSSMARIHGEMLYSEVMMQNTQQAAAGKLALVRSIPQDHRPKRN